MSDEITPVDHQMTSVETLALRGLLVREAEINRLVDTLNADYRQLFDAIEDRLGMERGAIPATHYLDGATGLVCLRE